MKCPNCNAEINDSAKFCPECGSKIDRKKYCPNCGTEVEANMKFCPECGTPISAPSTTTNKDNDYKFVGTTENVDSALYNESFKMVVDDVYVIQDRGVVLGGKIATGRIHVGDTVLITDKEKSAIVCKVLGIEMFRKLLDEGEAGDNCGILLDCLNPDYFSQEDIMFRIDEMSEDEYNSYQICSIDDEN